jgi:tRNA-splicing ligase RtcB (3'-phosphate/5'-hydroxy nucleic acid ligase)
LMRVTVSGGDDIVCTPHHPFMMKDGTYREARDLRFNDSLMPLYRKWQTRDGYESASTGKGGSRQTHVLVYESVNGPVPRGMVVHHKDHVHFNNEPGNLAAVEAGEHSRYHNITTYMADNPEHFRKSVAGNGLRGASVLARFNVSPRACDVIAVEYLAERADVYCLQVEEHHNFALAAGVFVHNCGMIATRTELTRDDLGGKPLAALRVAIEEAIPLSAGQYWTPPWPASSGGTQTRSSMRFRPRTKILIASWPTPPTLSRCVTPSARSSTSRATKPVSHVRVVAARGGRGPCPRPSG